MANVNKFCSTYYNSFNKRGENEINKQGGLIAYLFWITFGVIAGVILSSMFLRNFLC